MIVRSSHFWEAPKTCTVSKEPIVGVAQQRNRLLFLLLQSVSEGL